MWTGSNVNPYLRQRKHKPQTGSVNLGAHALHNSLQKGSNSPLLPLCTTFATWFSKFSQKVESLSPHRELELAVRLSLANGKQRMKWCCPNSEPRPRDTWSTSAHLPAHLPSTQEQAMRDCGRGASHFYHLRKDHPRPAKISKASCLTHIWFPTRVNTTGHLKWKTNRILANSTRNSAKCDSLDWREVWGKNGYMYMYGWVLLLFTWNYGNVVNWLYSNIK